MCQHVGNGSNVVVGSKRPDGGRECIIRIHESGVQGTEDGLGAHRTHHSGPRAYDAIRTAGDTDRRKDRTQVTKAIQMNAGTHLGEWDVVRA